MNEDKCIHGNKVSFQKDGRRLFCGICMNPVPYILPNDQIIKELKEHFLFQTTNKNWTIIDYSKLQEFLLQKLQETERRERERIIEKLTNTKFIDKLIDDWGEEEMDGANGVCYVVNKLLSSLQNTDKEL